jgi:hypothetical protein
MSLRKKFFKGLIVAPVCLLSVAMIATLPIFGILAILLKNKEYLTIPFLIFDIKTIIAFIIES